MTPEQLRERFRIDVDDLIYGDDDSAALFTNADIDYYMDEAQRRFVHDTRYLHRSMELHFSEGQDILPLPRRVIEIRSGRGFLKNAKTQLQERNYEDLTGIVTDDYGVSVDAHPFRDSQLGRPRAFTLDIDADRIQLFPTPLEADALQINAFIEARNVQECGELEVKNPRHIQVILDGMKALAYRKQDADAYDPNQAERWQQRFEQGILDAQSERKRRRRNPGVVRYGGL